MTTKQEISTVALRLFRRNKWRLWLLVLFYFVALSGNYALKMSTETLVVGESNASGDAVFAFQSNTRSFGESITIRDTATGEVLIDLCDIGVRRGQLTTWHPTKSNIIAEVPGDSPGEREIVEVTIRPNARIVRRKASGADEVQLVMVNQEDQLIHATVSASFSDGNRPSFEVFDGVGNTMRTVEFGRDETVYLSSSRDGSTIIAHFRATGFGDNVFTDGKTTGLLHLDARSGETLRHYRGHYIGIWNTHEWLAIPREADFASEPTKTFAGKTMLEVVHIDRPDQPVFRFAKGIPLRIDENSFATYESGSQSLTTIYDVGDGAAASPATRVVALPPWSEAQVAAGIANGQMLLVTNGTLQKLNLSTGDVTDVFGIRPWYTATRMVACLGLLVLSTVWLVLAWAMSTKSGGRRTSPIWDIVAVLLSCIAVLVFWSVNPSSRNIGLVNLLDFTIYVLLGTVVTLALVWASTLTYRWSQSLPLITTGGAALLAAFVAWRGADEGLLFLGVSALFVVFFMVGLTRLPNADHITRRLGLSAPSPHAQRTRNQFNLKHVGMIVVSFALLSFAMRSVSWSGEFVDLRSLGILGTFTPLMAVVMLVSVGAAVRDGNVLVSSLIWFVASSLLVGIHDGVSKLLAGGRSRFDLPIHLVGLCGALFVYAALVYVRMLVCRSRPSE